MAGLFWSSSTVHTTNSLLYAGAIAVSSIRAAMADSHRDLLFILRLLSLDWCLIVKGYKVFFVFTRIDTLFLSLVPAVR